MDQLPVILMTLNSLTLYPLNSVGRKISCLTSIIFISVFAYEFLSQYFEIERLRQIDTDKMSELDKKLSELYFDGLC